MRLAPAFVVTLATAACHKSEPIAVDSRDASPAAMHRPVPSSAPSATSSAKLPRGRRGNPAPVGNDPVPSGHASRFLNPKAASGGLIQAKATSCVAVDPDDYHLEESTVDCPPELDSSAWDACPYFFSIDLVDGKCFCETKGIGNPPPPWRVPCPPGTTKN